MKKPSKDDLYENILDICYQSDSFLSTPREMFSIQDLKLLQKGQIVSRCEIIEHKDSRDQECHAITAWAWLNDPTLTVYAGIAYLDDMGNWVQHSFASDTKGTLVEPTPILRDKYFGTPFNTYQTLDFVKAELQNIRNLGLDPNPLWKDRINHTMNNFDSIIQEEKIRPKTAEKFKILLKTAKEECEQISLEIKNELEFEISN